MSCTTSEAFKIQVPGGKIYVKTWTPESVSKEPPLILFHDSLGCVDLWKDFPILLAEKLSRRIVAYDRLGFGKSDARVPLPSIKFIEEEATTYFPVIKKSLSIQSYILFGHSVGGGMAINIAARDTDCQAVITVSAQAYVEGLTTKGIKDAKEMFEEAGQIERLENWHGPKARWVLQAWTDIWLSPEFSSWTLTSCIGNVRCPVLAIHGDQDEYGSPAFPRFISENTGGKAEMLLLKNCGHLPHKEKPQEVIMAVKKFLGNAI